MTKVRLSCGRETTRVDPQNCDRLFCRTHKRLERFHMRKG